MSHVPLHRNSLALACCLSATPFISAIALTLPTVASANTVLEREATDEDALQQATSVVIGHFTGKQRTATATGSVTNNDGTISEVKYVTTFYEFRVLKVVDGESVPETIEVKVRGGNSGGLVTPNYWRVPAARLAVGLALVGSKEADEYVAVGRRSFNLDNQAAFEAKAKSARRDPGEGRKTPPRPVGAPTDAGAAPAKP